MSLAKLSLFLALALSLCALSVQIGTTKVELIGNGNPTQTIMLPIQVCYPIFTPDLYGYNYILFDTPGPDIYFYTDTNCSSYMTHTGEGTYSMPHYGGGLVLYSWAASATGVILSYSKTIPAGLVLPNNVTAPPGYVIPSSTSSASSASASTTTSSPTSSTSSATTNTTPTESSKSCFGLDSGGCAGVVTSIVGALSTLLGFVLKYFLDKRRDKAKKAQGTQETGKEPKSEEDSS